MKLDLYPSKSTVGFAAKNTNIKYKYELEGQMQHS